MYIDGTNNFINFKKYIFDTIVFINRKKVCTIIFINNKKCIVYYKYFCKQKKSQCNYFFVNKKIMLFTTNIFIN